MFNRTSTGVLPAVAAAAPLVAIPATRPFVAYLWGAKSLTPTALIGIAMHVTSALAMALIGALTVLKTSGRIARWSVYQRSWDWMWGSFAKNHRVIQVTTDDAVILGTLGFADEPTCGRDIVLRDPAIYDPETEQYWRNGMKFMWIPAVKIKRVELSIADPPVAADQPILPAGYITSDDEVQDGGQEGAEAKPGQEAS